MTTRPPAVVAVVVTRDPGPWFEETLAALGAQTYEDMSVLVLVAGGSQDPTDRVGAVLPGAFVGVLDDSPSYGAAVNRGLGMVEGAALFLLCHDDCAPDPDAVQLMVQESFRSNAGIVSPKVVRWDDPDALVHVGQGIDKTGAIVERVLPGEIDAGQHDSVVDVFVAPGGCLLVRADLMRALGGYDEHIVSMGEELDLSWRAHVAGARVIVAPQARVRHIEVQAAGARPPAVGDGTDGDRASLQALQRRHELRAVLTCYTWPHRLRVVPQAAVLALGEIVAAALVGDRERVRTVAGAWVWNLRHRDDIRRHRAEVAKIRVLDDAEVRSLQVRGSARLSTYVSRLSHQGIEVAHGLRRGEATGATGSAGDAGPAGSDGAAGEGPEEAAGRVAREEMPDADLAGGSGAPDWDEPVLTGSLGIAFAEDSEFDELDDLGRRSGRDRHGRRRPLRVLATHRSRLAVWVVALIVGVVGARDLIGRRLPLIGQFAPMLSWTSTWHRLLAGWQPTGVGSNAPASPVFGVLGILGTLLFGRMGLLQEVIVFASIPLGVWGLARLLRPFASARGRFAGALVYLALPLAWDALARGRVDGLVAYALTPWVLLHLARATRIAPYDAARGGAPGATAPRVQHAASKMAAVRFGRVGRIVRGPLWRVLALGAIEAVGVAAAPAMALVVLVAAAGVAGASLAFGEARAAGRVLAVGAGATVVAAVVCLPWLVWTASAGRAGLGAFGAAGNPASEPGLGALVRLAVGPVGASPLAWLLIAAAVAPLLIARRTRLRWAASFWAVAVGSWALALVSARAWAVPFAPSIVVVLAPAAAAVACGAGLGVAAFDADLAGFRFGWRQGVAALSVMAIAVGLLPTIAEAADGRWGVPPSGDAQAVSLAPFGSGPGYRVLWVGDPQALPLGSWSVAPGLAYATSADGLPDASDTWAPAAPGRASVLGSDLSLLMDGGTVELGRLLLPERVQYVVVATRLAPSIPSVQQPVSFPAPAGLLSALGAQDDLESMPSGTAGLDVFENAAMTEATVSPLAPAPSTGSVIVAPRGAGQVLDTAGWAAELVLWLLVAAVLIGRRRWMSRLWQRLRGRRRRRRSPAPAAPTGDGSVLDAGHDASSSDVIVAGDRAPLSAGGR